MKLLLNREATLSIFSDATNENRWLCNIPLDNGKDYQATFPEHLHDFILLFKQPKSFEEINSTLKITNPKNIKKYKTLIEEFLVPKGILLSQDNNYIAPKLIKNKPQHMQLQLPIVRPELVNLISRFLQYLFHPILFLIVIAFSIASQLFFYTSIESNYSNIWQLTSPEQTQIILLVGSGLLFHELGHAAAAFKYGCRKIELGVGWYICFFVFYAELSESWRLQRKKRVIIDCGGMYFQAIFTSLLIIIQIQTSSIVILYAITMLNISFIWNLNPFFRMDGYWIASDLLGISNLREATKEDFNRLFAKCFNKEYKLTHNLPTKSKKLLLVYTVTSNIFFCYMIYFLSKKLLYTLAEVIPQRIDSFQEHSFLSSSTLDTFVMLTGGLFQIMMLMFFSVFLYRSMISFWNLLLKVKEYLTI
jgi:putative peptide zinc metalloprotease protein